MKRSDLFILALMALATAAWAWWVIRGFASQVTLFF
jgi:hypothetical protein